MYFKNTVQLDLKISHIDFFFLVNKDQSFDLPFSASNSSQNSFDI